MYNGKMGQSKKFILVVEEPNNCQRGGIENILQKVVEISQPMMEQRLSKRINMHANTNFTNSIKDAFEILPVKHKA